MWYEVRYTLTGLETVTAIPAAIALAVVAIAVPGEALQRALLGTVAVLVLCCGIWLRLHQQKVFRRSGSFLRLPCSGDFFPRTEEEFVQAVQAIASRGQLATIVGGGWGFYIKRQVARGPRIYTHRMTGAVPADDERWLAGTTIRAVTEHYRRSAKKSFWSNPSMEFISLGSHLAFGNHGSSGDLGKPSSFAYSSARLVNLRDGSTKDLDGDGWKARLRDHFDPNQMAGKPPVWAVISVRINKQRLADSDQWLQKRMVRIENPATATEWLHDGAVLRILFVGAARARALGLRWEMPCSDTHHVDPHGVVRFSTWLQADVCSAACGLNERLGEAWSGKTKLYNANRWIPWIPPIFSLVAVWLGVRNFEVVFRSEQLAGSFGGAWLWSLIEQLHRFHSTAGGRSEVRWGGSLSDKTSGSPVFIDVSLRDSSTASIRRFFEMLSALGVARVALHAGKFDRISVLPCKQTALKEIYFGGAQKPRLRLMMPP